MTTPAAITSFSLISPAFEPGQPIPARSTSDGTDASPPLAWSGAPAGTATFALVLHDPDAPDPAAPKRDWVHWVLYDIPAGTTGIAEGASAGTGAEALPDGTREGQHDGGGSGWSGPCPPRGRHRYFFELYALDVELRDLGARATRADVERAMQGHVLGHGQLVGTYERGGR
jgi:Raf kinase inhibitor-like YbhB/YbcL family protein